MRYLIILSLLFFSLATTAQITSKTFSSLATMTSVDGSTYFVTLDGTPKVWKKFTGATLRAYVNPTVTSISNGSGLTGISSPYEGDLAINTAKDTLWIRDDAAWIVFKAGTSGSTPNLQNVLVAGNSANSSRITNLGTPISGTDATTKNYVDTQVSAGVDAAGVYASAVADLARDTAVARSIRALRDSLARTAWITQADMGNNSVGSNQIITGAVGADELANSGVTAGSYTAANITVDQDGRVTSASNGSGGGGSSAPAQEIVFGSGSGTKSDPKIKVDSTSNSIELTSTTTAKTSVKPGVVELRGDTLLSQNIYLNILPNRNSPYTYAPFRLVAEQGSNGVSPPYNDYVWSFGPNTNGNTGVAADPTKPMASINWETSWLDGGVPTFEIHEHWKMPDSNAIRLNSYTIRYPVAPISGNRRIDVDKYESANRFYVKTWWNPTFAMFATSYDRTAKTGTHTFALNDSSSIVINGSSVADGSGNINSTISNVETSGRNQRLNFANWNQYIFGDTGTGNPQGVDINTGTSTITARRIKNHDQLNTYVQAVQGFQILRGSQPYGIQFRNVGNTATNAALTVNEGTGEVQYFVSSGGFFPTFYASGSEAMRLNGSQEALFGTTTDNGAFRVQVSGNQYVSGSIAVGTTSANSTLQVAGSQASSIFSIVANTTLDVTHNTVIIPTGSAFTATLPSASSITGRQYRIVNQTAGSKTIGSYVDFAGSTVTTIATATSILVQSDGTNWQRVQ